MSCRTSTRSCMAIIFLPFVGQFFFKILDFKFYRLLVAMLHALSLSLSLSLSVCMCIDMHLVPVPICCNRHFFLVFVSCILYCTAPTFSAAVSILIAPFGVRICSFRTSHFYVYFSYYFVETKTSASLLICIP